MQQLSRHKWTGSALLALALLSFTACQSVSGNAPNGGNNGGPGIVSAAPASLAFGNVQAGNSASLPEKLTNTGGTAVTISQANLTGSTFSISGLTLPATINPSQSLSFTVTFSPKSAGAASGTLAIVSDGSNSPLDISLTGTGITNAGTLSANPASLSFGTVQVGSSSSLSETVSNTSNTSVTISQANVTGTAFSVSGLTLPVTLNAGQSVTFSVKFTPTVAGAANGTLAIVSDASNSPLNIALSGTGAAQGQLAVSPASLNFGNVTVGASSSLGGTLSASGASVTISSGSSNSSEFVLSGISLPHTLSAGQNVSFTVTFTPTAAGTANATLSFVSNAANSPTTQALTGNGTTPPQHSVDLSWTENGGAGVVGYNVYRGGVNGGPYSRINGSLDGTTAYTDNNVSAGQTYYYVVTAVDSNNVESGYSNQAQVTVPTP